MTYMQSVSQQHPGIVNNTLLQQATAGIPPNSSVHDWSTAQLAAAAPALLALVSKSAVLLVLSVLSELLMHGQLQQQQQLLHEAGRLDSQRA
jgi:hypothetical protein